MKPRLILHIGTHKTGSSALQEVLEAERPALAAAGFLYGATDRPPFADLPKHTSLFKALRRGEETFAAERAAIEEEVDRTGAHTLILSEEGLSSPYALAFDRIGGLSDRFEIEIICYLRRPDRFAESLWNQFAREGFAREGIAAFLDSDLGRRHLDLQRNLDFWEGIGALNVFGYEEAAGWIGASGGSVPAEGASGDGAGDRLGHGIVAHFAAATGVPLPPVNPVHNASPSMSAAAVMVEVNRQRKGEISAADWGLLEARLGPERRMTAMGRRLRRDFLDRMAPVMAAWEARYGVVFPVDMPEEPDDPIPPADPELVAWFLEHLRRADAGGVAG